MSDRKPPPGAVEFELTDFNEARRILDLPPAGVVESQQLAPDYWKSRRRPSIPTDRALTSVAMDWVIGLPAQVRPLQLCERFPRIANAIAQEWTQPLHCEALLAGLLTDRRRARIGFPAVVLDELERLVAFRSRRP